MMRTEIVIRLFLISLSACVTKARRYEITLREEASSSIVLTWEVDYKINAVDFTLYISAPTREDSYSVVGLGMSDRDDVLNADVMMIRFNEDSVIIQDSWSDAYGLIIPDEKQDYRLFEYDVREDHVSVKFWRYFDTHDEHDYKLDNGTTNLFYLLDSTEESSGASPHVRIMPGMEGLWDADIPDLNTAEMEYEVTQVQLLKPDIPESYFGSELAEEISTFDILQPNITLPPQVTTYWCSVQKFPEAVSHKKVHGIGFGANIRGKSEGVVHHMEVFLCDPSDEKVSEYSGLCGAEKEPEDVKRCSRVLAAWAHGAEDIYYPKEAGIPFGEVTESRYVRLEVHYHNPKKMEGIIDNSGIRFYYSNKLREYDAGVLEVGITYNNNLGIPPRQADFVLSGVCPGKCTAEGIPPHGINIFASQLHAHLAGRKIWISHFRGETELPELNRDDHYDTGFEDIRQIYPPRRIMPGDSIVTSCSYNTMNRKNVTTTGDGMFDEMCVSYLHYYPLSRLEVCKSSTSASALEEFFIIEKIFTGYPTSLNFTNLGENYNHMEWSDSTVNQLRMTYENSAQDVECKQHNGKQLPGTWDELKGL